MPTQAPCLSLVQQGHQWSSEPAPRQWHLHPGVGPSGLGWMSAVPLWRLIPQSSTKCGQMRWHWYPGPRWHPHRTSRQSRKTICADCQEWHLSHYADCLHMRTPSKKDSTSEPSHVAVEHSRNSTLALSRRGTQTTRVSAAWLPLLAAPPNCIHCRHESLLSLDGSPSCKRGRDWTSGCQVLKFRFSASLFTKSEIRKKKQPRSRSAKWLITAHACLPQFAYRNINYIW